MKFIEDSQKPNGSWYHFIMKIYMCIPPKVLAKWFSSKFILVSVKICLSDLGAKVKLNENFVGRYADSIQLKGAFENFCWRG